MGLILACVAGLVLLLAPGAGQAQRRVDGELDFKQVERLYLDDVHAGVDGERIVALYFRALTQYSVPIKGLRAPDIEIWEDEERIETGEILDVEALESTGQGVTAVLAIDASGTMRGEPFGRAKDAALAFLERLQPEDRVAVVSFAEDVRVVAGFGLSRVETRQALRSLEIDLERSQHTLLRDGAYRAIDLIRTTPDLPRRAFVILFSDGKDGGSDRSRERVVQGAKGTGEEPHILIFSIGYARFGGGGMDEMRRMAEETGGDFLQAESMVHLRDFFDAIATQMMSSYLVHFRADLDGEEHELRITIESQSSSRKVSYPSISGPIWPWLVALAVLALGAVAFLVARSFQRAGRITIDSGARAGTVIMLKAGRNRIGALEDNEIVLPSTTVSRYHAEIVARGRQVQISDLRSKNGTRVNGQPVQQSPLAPGDRISIADIELVYDS